MPRQSDKLHTSLLVPTFDLTYNRPFSFYYDFKHKRSGYVVTRRQMSPEEREQQRQHVTAATGTAARESTHTPGQETSVVEHAEQSPVEGSFPDLLPRTTEGERDQAST